MKIYKSINNNIVSAFDHSGREVVVIGRGIGFKAAEGDDVPAHKITKIFVMSSQDNLDRLKDLFTQLQKEYIEITDEILTHAKQKLSKNINESAYFTLADHISFAVNRIQNDMGFENILTAEVRRFYPEEFKVGQYAIKLIKEKMGVAMPEDEAASIAMHILNAQYDISYSEGFKATQLLSWILARITKHAGMDIETQNHYGERFVTHLKYLLHRIVRKEATSDGMPLEGDEWIYDMMKAKYPQEIECCEKIAAEIFETHGYKMLNNEIGYMAVHLRRVSL